MNRRDLILYSAGMIAGQIVGGSAQADVPAASSRDTPPPMDGRASFVAWMETNRGEDTGFLGERWDWFKALLAHRDLWGERNKRGFLMTPREDFVTRRNLDRAYV